METIFNLITGGLTIIMFCVYLFWAYIGLFVHSAIDLLERKPESENSPKDFQIGYYWADNKKRLVLAAILIPIGIILSSQIFGVEISLFVAFSIGFYADKLGVTLKKKSIIKGA